MSDLRSGPTVSAPVLDPFAAFAKGVLHVWTQRRGRSPRYLQQIIRTCRLESEGDSVEAMTSARLTAFIMAAVRTPTRRLTISRGCDDQPAPIAVPIAVPVATP